MYYTIEYYKYPKVNIYKVTKENIECKDSHALS